MQHRWPFGPNLFNGYSVTNLRYLRMVSYGVMVMIALLFLLLLLARVAHISCT